MKKTLIILSSLLCASSSFADNKIIHFGGSVPISHYRFQSDSQEAKAGQNMIGFPCCFALNAGFGYKITDKFNLGIDALYYFNQRHSIKVNNKIDSGDGFFGPVVLANTTWNLYNFNDISSLYLTGGLGFSYYSLLGSEFVPKMKFAWKAGFGTVVKISDDKSIDIGYSFVNLGKVSSDNIVLPGDLDSLNSFATHNINISLRLDI